MEENEDSKTYMWLVIITFVAFTLGVTFGFMHLQTYTDETQNPQKVNLFR